MDFVRWLWTNAQRMILSQAVGGGGRSISDDKCYLLIPLSKLIDEVEDETTTTTTTTSKIQPPCLQRDKILHDIKQATTEMLSNEFGQRHDLDDTSSYVLIETSNRRPNNISDDEQRDAVRGLLLLDNDDHWKVVGHVKIQEKKANPTTFHKFTSE